METITIDALSRDSVSVKTQRYVEVEGVGYSIGEAFRCAYVNSVRGREDMATKLEEPYLSAVLTVWGDTPTVEEIEPEEEQI